MVATRPNFTGEWALNRERSTLQVAALQALESAVVHIDHHDPAFRLRRRFVLQGAEHNVEIDLMADGEERMSEVGNQRRYARLTWSGDALIFTTRITAPEGTSLNVVRYELGPAGALLEAHETFRGPAASYDNVWVFARR